MKSKLFISYSHKDSDFKDSFISHIKLLERQGKLFQWHDQMIDSGDEWKQSILDNINSANIIILLISVNFINSDFCWGIEMEIAMKRHENKEARVIPIILRPCDWHTAPFGILKALPIDGKPIITWNIIDEGWLNVVNGIKCLIF
ncbi:MAG: toll/interleukin-1 receptor domain-containing protein [Bacteroidales bacterium]|nr:toll/interleukin-1 receptor domain-containing protein [Bacteroidales bacterium]